MATIATLAAAFGAAPALADTHVDVDGNVLTIRSGLVQENDITLTKVTASSSIVRVTEAAGGPKVNARKGCAQNNNRQAQCVLGSGTTVHVDLQGGDDSYTAFGSPLPHVVDGGVGRDTINTGDANDTLHGGTGSDNLGGGPGLNRLNGDSGDDSMDGGPGADTFSGGPGSDQVSYLLALGVTLDLRVGTAQIVNQASDGVAADVENIHGGRGSDILTGTGGDNRFIGQNIAGSTTGSPGLPDTFTGLGGDDSIDASRNRARDTVSCGAGDDDITLDLADPEPLDPSLDGCETIERLAVDQHPAVVIRRKRARVARGRILVPLRCPRSSHRSCSGRLSTRRLGGARLGEAARYRIHRGRGRTVSVALSRTARRLVARRGRLRVEITARERDTKGRPKVTVARFKLRGS